MDTLLLQQTEHCQGPYSHSEGTLFCYPTVTQQSSMHSYPLPLSLKGMEVKQAVTAACPCPHRGQ